MAETAVGSRASLEIYDRLRNCVASSSLVVGP